VAEIVIFDDMSIFTTSMGLFAQTILLAVQDVGQVLSEQTLDKI